MNYIIQANHISSLNILLALQDTRTHAIGELYDTERSYVESLQILVTVRIFLFIYLFFNHLL